MLLPELLRTFEAHDATNGLCLDIIRRGTSVMFLKHNSIIFMDGANFLPGSGLEDAGKTFGATVHKSAFPYEHYTDLESMKNDTEWPSYSAFKSTLRPYVVSDAEQKLKNAISKAIEKGLTASKMVEMFNLYDCCSDVKITDEASCPSFSIVDHSSFTLDPEVYVDSFIIYNELKSKGEVFNMHDYMLAYNIRKGFRNTQGNTYSFWLFIISPQLLNRNNKSLISL